MYYQIFLNDYKYRQKYYLSDPAFGYSVDNLAPETPKGLNAVCTAGQEVTLSWKANKERDMSHYLVYQSTELFSDPSQLNLIAITSDTSCQVGNLSLEQTNYFAVVAQDIHHNQSGLSALVTVEPTGVQDEL